MSNVFSDKLKFLRNDKKISQENAAKGLNISRGKFGHWETGRTEPNIEELVQISTFFGCTLDYIMDSKIPVKPIIYKK